MKLGQWALLGSLGSGLLLWGCNPEPHPEPAPSPTTSTRNTSPSPVELEAPSDGFERLRLVDFHPFPEDSKAWTEQRDVIHCTGSPKGYLHSTESFGDFTLRAEFRFLPTPEQLQNPDKLNTGFMIAIQEPQKVWPRSLEVQGRYDEIGTIKSNGGVPALVINDHPDARQAARRSPEEWNTIEIVCRAGAIASRLNGERICESEPGEVASGQIGLQSEGNAVEFRNLRIQRGVETQ